jgi:hypothetical protein
MKDNNLCKVAIDNLLFLNKGSNFITNEYKLNHLSFESSKDDTFDTIYSLKELEYPLYFTINQLLNEIHTSYDYTIHGYHKIDILRMLTDVIEMLYQYYETTEETSDTFEKILDNLDDKVFSTQGYYKYGVCFWLPTQVKNYLDCFCLRSIQISKEIVNDYLEDIYSPGRYNDGSSDEDSSDSSDGLDGVDGDDVDGESKEVVESTDDLISKEPSDEGVDSKKVD